MYIGGLGELVRLVRPPATGISASFRLRFRFVRVLRAVRAGEAKLRGRMQTVILIAGPPGCEYPGVLSSGFCSSFVHRRVVLTAFGTCPNVFPHLLLLCAWVLTSDQHNVLENAWVLKAATYKQV